MGDNPRMLIVSRNDISSTYSEAFSPCGFDATTCNISQIQVALKQQEGNRPLAVVLLNDLRVTASRAMLDIIADTHWDFPPHIVIASPISREIMENYSNRPKFVQPIIDDLTKEHPDIPIMCFLDLPWDISRMADSIREVLSGKIKPSNNIILPSSPIKSENSYSPNHVQAAKDIKKQTPHNPCILFVDRERQTFEAQQQDRRDRYGEYGITAVSCVEQDFGDLFSATKQKTTVAAVMLRVTPELRDAQYIHRIIAHIMCFYPDDLPRIVLYSALDLPNERARKAALRSMDNILAETRRNSRKLNILGISNWGDFERYINGLKMFIGGKTAFSINRTRSLAPSMLSEHGKQEQGGSITDTPQTKPQERDTDFRRKLTKNGLGPHILFALDDNDDYASTANLIAEGYAQNSINVYTCVRGDLGACIDQFEEMGVSFSAVVIRKPNCEKEELLLAKHIKYLRDKHKENPPALVLYEYGRKDNGADAQLRKYVDDISAASKDHFDKKLFVIGISSWSNDTSIQLIKSHSIALLYISRGNYASLTDFPFDITFPPHLRSHEKKPFPTRNTLRPVPRHATPRV